MRKRKNLSRQYNVFIVAPSIPFFVVEKNKTVNRCYIFSRSGEFDFQDKLFMTRFEDEEWGISSSETIGPLLLIPITNTIINPTMHINYCKGGHCY